MTDRGSGAQSRGRRRSVLLPPEPTSVRRGRHLVRHLLEDLSIPITSETIDDVVLLTSELLTNAVVHARTQVHLEAMVGSGRVHVSVADESHRLPRTNWTTDLTPTGRGMHTVACLSHRYGVEPTPDGKVTWFEIALFGQPQSDLPPGESDPRSVGSRTAPAEKSTRIVLQGVPARSFLVWQQHASALLRERLISHLRQEPRLAAALADEVAEAHEALTALDSGLDDIVAALRGGRAVVDLQIDIPVALAVRFSALREALQTANLMVEHGILLGRRTPPELAALRDWCCSEVIRQIDGQQPRRWRGPRAKPAAS